MKKLELIKLLNRCKGNPEITFWLDDDIILSLEDIGEFNMSPEITIGFKVLGRCASRDKPNEIMKSIKKHVKKKRHILSTPNA